MDFHNPEKTANEGIDRYEAFIKEIGMPISITEIGGKEEDIPKLVESMFHGAPNHGNFIPLTKEIASEIYHMAL